MRILITGARGQLGVDCRRVLEGAHTVTGLDLPELDIADAGAVAGAVDALRPEVILNCAAYTRVDAAETDRDACRRTNADGPRILAEACRAADVRLIHLSTDYVFDGRREPPLPYVETDRPAPPSWYGRTKLAGEEAVRAVAPRHVILRTAWLYGAQGANFPRAILTRALRQPGSPLKVVNDQFGTPTWSYRLALQIRAVLERAEAAGLYHATAGGCATWFEFARHFLARMGVPADVVPCATGEYPAAAARPRNSILENARLKAEGLYVMRPWQEDVDVFVVRHGDRLRAEIEESRS